MEKNRVRIEINNPKRFTQTAYNNLNNKTGIILEWQENNALVEFDIPADKLHTCGLPIYSFWFDSLDLINLGNNV